MLDLEATPRLKETKDRFGNVVQIELLDIGRTGSARQHAGKQEREWNLEEFHRAATMAQRSPK